MMRECSNGRSADKKPQSNLDRLPITPDQVELTREEAEQLRAVAKEALRPDMMRFELTGNAEDTYAYATAGEVGGYEIQQVIGIQPELDGSGYNVHVKQFLTDPTHTSDFRTTIDAEKRAITT